MHTLADIIRRFGPAFIQKHHPNAWQLRILNSLIQCRTAGLGGHKYRCEQCGCEHISYNSCRNRHCPQCQGARQQVWIQERIQGTLPVQHYHLVFTVPEALNGICLMNPRWFYSRMFACVWETLRQFGYTRYGVESGALAVLHTWGQNLGLHPHIHCLVPAAGLTLNGKLRHIGQKGLFLYPVRGLGVCFRAKLMGALRNHPSAAAIQTQQLASIRKAWQKPWVVYCQPSLGRPDQLMGYLGQYIYRVAITNQRIVRLTDRHVTFCLKDYRDGARRKIMTLEGVEFLRRFCLHILPARFVKIRYYGIYSSRYNQLRGAGKMVIKEAESPPGLVAQQPELNVMRCPVCKTGRLLLVEVIPRARSPSLIYAKAFVLSE